VDISDELVLSVQHPNGVNGYTLTTRLGQMISEAESLYGERDRSFTILGVEFFDGVPHILFPENCQHVAVRIDKSCLKDPQKAYFQLSQEVIHLLNPTPVHVNSANNLEEGVATHFSVLYMKNFFGVDCSKLFAGSFYDECRRTFEDVLMICPDFGRKIRDTAGIGRAFSRATEQDILAACPNCPTDKVRFLAAPFGTRP
jgi:hypothetical protein